MSGLNGKADGQKRRPNIVVRLARFEGPFVVTMVLSWVFGALSGIVSIGMYLFIYLVADAVLASGQAVDPDVLGGYGWQALVLASAAFGTYGLGLMFSHLTAFNTISQIRVSLVRHLERVPLGYFSSNPSGEIRKTVEKNVESVEGFVAHQMPDLAQSIVMPIAFLASMLFFDWRMAVVCMIPIAIGFAALVSMLKSESSSLIEHYQKALGEMSSTGVEYVRGIGVVKVFGQTVRSFGQFFGAIMRYKRFSLDYVMSMEKPMAVYMTAVNGAFLVLVPAGILLYQFSGDPGAALRSLVFFIVFMPLVSVIMTRIMDCSSSIMMASQALDSIESILQAPVQRRRGQEASSALSGTGIDLPRDFGIVFDDVRFRYGDEASWALDGLSFEVPAGTVTALVGPSGSGKSTVTNLIARFWDVTQGRVMVGGVDVADLPYDWWMRRCACVFQDSELLKATVAENVSFCRDGATEEDILRALHEAQCDGIVAKLPEGIHTIVGSDGVYLSGGERQRIALARAILQDAPVILLDEATSFADPENEHLILRALETLTRGKTVIMIAHRLSTVTGANAIVVMDDGRAVEQGTHAALLEQGGTYTHMFEEYGRSTAWRVGSGASAASVSVLALDEAVAAEGGEGR